MPDQVDVDHEVEDVSQKAAEMIVCTVFKEYRLADVSRKQILGAVKRFLPRLCRLIKLNEISKGRLTRYAARGFLDNGVVEIRGGDDKQMDDITREDIKQVRTY